VRYATMKLNVEKAIRAERFRNAITVLAVWKECLQRATVTFVSAFKDEIIICRCNSRSGESRNEPMKRSGMAAY
jgi:hypothetical protein